MNTTELEPELDEQLDQELGEDLGEDLAASEDLDHEVQCECLHGERLRCALPARQRVTVRCVRWTSPAHPVFLLLCNPCLFSWQEDADFVLVVRPLR